ncbi:MAG: Uma2 family endonuclease [Pseudomonadota bacterium]
MNWDSVLQNPLLQNLPFKIELNKWGKILMSPASNNHGKLQFEMGTLIDRKKKSGTIIMECSIETSDGVKVADVVWASDNFIHTHGYETPYKVAPEICVEIISPSNSKAEIAEKIQLYLAKGAIEVWTCDNEGSIHYFSHIGELEKSKEI